MNQSRNYLRPTYFNEFQCIGGACEDTCCAGWNITIDTNSYQQYKKVKNPLIGKKLRHSIVANESKDIDFYNKAYFKLDEDKKCTMLTDEGLCSIHSILGEQALCHTCAIYPRQTVSLNKTIEKSLLLSCPEAARVVLNRPEGLDFFEDHGIESTLNIKELDLPDEHFNLFWTMRIFLIDTFQNRKHPLETRLFVAALFIQKYVDLTSPTLENVQPLIQQYTNYLQLDDLENQLSNISTNYTHQLLIASKILSLENSPSYNALATIIKQQLGLSPDNNLEHALDTFEKSLYIYKKIMQDYDYVLENYLVNALFMNIYDVNQKELLNKFTKICVDFTMIRIYLIGYLKSKEHIQLQDILYCIQQYTKYLSHNSSYNKNIEQILQQGNTSTLSQVTNMILINHL